MENSDDRCGLRHYRIHFFSVTGWHHPLLHEENLSDLTVQEGMLRVNKNSKHTFFYLESANGKKRGIEFVGSYNPGRFEAYKNESVTVWRSGRYVYQMVVNEDEVYPLKEANNNVKFFNLSGIFQDLIVIGFILWETFLAMSIAKEDRIL